MARGIQGKAVAGLKLQSVDQVGDANGALPIVFHKKWTAGTGTHNIVPKLPFKVRVIDVKLIPTAASAGATAVLTDGSNTIADVVAGTGIIIAVAGTIGVVEKIDSTYATLDKGDKLVLSVTDAGGGTSTGDAFVVCVRVDE